MPLDLTGLARQTRQAVDGLPAAEARLRRSLAAARAVLARHDWEHISERVAARRRAPWLAGLPLGPTTPLVEAPPPVDAYTVVSTDGSHIDQDHHGAFPCWLMNIGLAAIVYGPSPTARLETRTQLGYRQEDLYAVFGDARFRVQGQVLNVWRQVAEIAALADLCQELPGSVALIDGTLLLTSISRSMQEEPSYFLRDYLGHLDRIRASGAIVASYISRPSGSDVVGALRFAACPLDECDRACRLGQAEERACGAMADLLDRALVEALAPTHGARTGLWRSTWPTSDRHYREHAVHFFYLDVGSEIARVEVPAWVAESEIAMARLHGVLLAQAARGDDGYPRALIEAHHKAVITAGDRRGFAALLDDAFAGRGYASLPSAKERAKRRRAI